MFKFFFCSCLIYIFSTIQSTAQNLILNPSLEEFPDNKLPKKNNGRINEPIPSYWTFLQTVDLYYSGHKKFWCCKPGNNIAPDGEFYSGLILFVSDQPFYREYAIAKLERVLVKGKKYSISLQLQFDNLPIAKVESLHLFFLRNDSDKNMIRSADLNKAINVIQLPGDSGLSKNWFLFTDTITAEGGENEIGLGNLLQFNSELKTFRKEPNLQNTKSKKGNEIYDKSDINEISYIFFDQFSLTEVEESPTLTDFREDIVKINSIRFKFDDTLYLSEYSDTLKLLIDTLKSTSLQVLLTGYTDNLGNYDYNLLLSKKRANAIRNILVKNGIDPNTISIDYKSFFNPIGSNNSEEQRSLNRRVEIALKKKPD